MSTDHNSAESGSQSSGSENQRGHGTLILALVVAALVLVGGVTAWVANRNSDDNKTTGTSATTSAPMPSSDAGASGFAVPETDRFNRRIDIPNNQWGQPLSQTVPPRTARDADWLTAAPAGTREKGGWQKVTGAVVPFSTSDGPTGIRDGLPTGWAHTPQGCALAAAYIAYEVNARPGDRVIRERALTTSAADLAKFDADRAAGKIPDRAPAVVTQWMLAFDAFKIGSWQEDLCVVKLASKTEPDKVGAPHWLGTSATMVWDGAAWRLRPPTAGNPPQEAVPTLAGWTTW
ncbi:hypothetical protein [Nocardia brasiliensis]|uniref:hypothetical protein n=1 Tax=Nocardia brasiliensis TaxID=37326 RepID=UPI002457308F|nr:hypothetical protein [Nocardia brasiliensis]